MQPARSLVMVPLSTVSTHTLSRVWANLQKSQFLSIFAFVSFWDSKMSFYNWLNKIRIAIKFASVLQASSPGENTGNRVCAGRSPLKVKSESWRFSRSFESKHVMFYFYHVVAVELHILHTKEDSKKSLLLILLFSLIQENSLRIQSWRVTKIYLLVFTVVPGHRAVCCLSLDGFTIRTDENRCHQSQGAKT